MVPSSFSQVTPSFRLLILICCILFLGCIAVPSAMCEKLTLSGGIKTVTEDSRIVKISKEEEAMALADTRIARSGLLPRGDASYTQNYQDVQQGIEINNQGTPVTMPMMEKSFYTWTISVQQLLFDFGGVSSYYRASQRIYETKQLNTKRVKNSAALQFAFAYYDLLEAEKMVTVAAKETKRIEEHLANAEKLYKEGVITRNDLLQAQVRLSDAQQKLITTQNLRRISYSRLNNLLARPLSTQFEAEETAAVPPNGLELEGVQSTAEKDRYEMRIVDTTLEAVRFEESAKRSEYFPKFFLQGQFNHTKNKYQIHNDIFSVMAGMNFNFFSGGSTVAAMSKLASQKQRLAVERRKLADDIRLEVEQYYLNMINAQEKIKVTKGAIAQAEDNLKINKVKYTEGAGTATDVTDAITLLTIAETNYYKSVYELDRAYAGLMYATGKDLTEVYK